jgi:V/A-type H+/Na+-transporting ATPase subunit E
MTLERVKNEITAAAKTKARQMIEEAKKQAKTIIADAENQFEPQARKIEEETRMMREAIIVRERSSANLDAKKKVFEERKKLIDEAFSRARKSLVNLPQAKRQALLKAYLDKASKELKIGKIYCSREDVRFIKGYSVEETDISGGLIAESEDGLMRVDYSLDTMIAAFREKDLQNVVKILTT